jgi:hypothetical protein
MPFSAAARVLQLAGENDLAVAGLEHKPELPIAALAQLEMTCHRFLLGCKKRPPRRGSPHTIKPSPLKPDIS